MARTKLEEVAEREFADRRPVLVRCAHCPETFDGVLVDARQWFARHRSSEHPELGPTKSNPRKRVWR